MTLNILILCFLFINSFFFYNLELRVRLLSCSNLGGLPVNVGTLRRPSWQLFLHLKTSSQVSIMKYH